MTARRRPLSASLIDGTLLLPALRVPAARGRRAAADPDEDGVTLAAAAALELLDRNPDSDPDALILATISPPYDEGGNVQALAELLGIAGDRLALELTATLRDGLASVRVAAALGGTVLVCASHRRRPRGDGEAGDGAAAVLLGPAGEAAGLICGPARVEQIRDRWRLAGEAEPHEGDPSFAWPHGAPRAARLLGSGRAAAVGPSARASDQDDPLVEAVGILGSAHPLARLLLMLDTPGVLVASAGGLSEAISVDPGTHAADVAARARAALASGREASAPIPAPEGEGFAPYASLPRAWRERGQDLRLEAAHCESCGRLLYPPPSSCPSCGLGATLRPARLGRTGTVLTCTLDHAYPQAKVTGMAVVEIDGGGRFYGQVVPSGSVEPGSQVRLVPRRLHAGGGFVQYFWKVAPERP